MLDKDHFKQWSQELMVEMVREEACYKETIVGSVVSKASTLKISQ